MTPRSPQSESQLTIYRMVKRTDQRRPPLTTRDAVPRLLVNRQDAAAMMGVSVDLIEVWVRQGVLKPVLVTDRSDRRYRVRDLEALAGLREAR